MKLGQSNIFSSVCQEFCLQQGEYLGRYTPQAGTPPWADTLPWVGTPPGQVPPGQVHTPSQVHTPWAGTLPPGRYTTTPWVGTPPDQVNPPRRYYEIRSMSGRYASYWNAFLYMLMPTRLIHFQITGGRFELSSILINKHGYLH